jgi:hypothetical protein
VPTFNVEPHWRTVAQLANPVGGLDAGLRLEQGAGDHSSNNGRSPPNEPTV